MDWAPLVIGFLIGILSGVISGAFGIGGSSIIIVLLRVLLGLKGNVAIATALPLSIPAALGGTVIYNRHKLIKFKTALICGVTGSVFSILGALATQYVACEFLMLGVAVILLVSAYVIHGSKEKDRKKSCKQTMKEKVANSVFIGAVAGFASGFLGIGGGIILVPMLAKFRKIRYKEAIPCSLFVMLIYVVPASITHFSLGHVDIPILLALGLGAAIGAVISANRIVKIKEKEVKKWFAIVLAFFGTLLLLYELGILSVFTG